MYLVSLLNRQGLPEIYIKSFTKDGLCSFICLSPSVVLRLWSSNIEFSFRLFAEPLETNDRLVVGLGRPEKPTSSTWQTRRKDGSDHAQSYAQSGSPGS